MITNNENALTDDLNNQDQGGGSNSFGTPGSGDSTNSNYSDDVDNDSGIDENSLDDTEGGGSGNIPGSYSSNESMSGTNSPDDDDDLDLTTGGDIDEGLLAEDDLVDDEDDELDTDYDEDEDDLDLDEDDDTADSEGTRPGIV